MGFIHSAARSAQVVPVRRHGCTLPWPQRWRAAKPLSPLRKAGLPTENGGLYYYHYVFINSSRNNKPRSHRPGHTSSPDSGPRGIGAPERIRSACVPLSQRAPLRGEGVPAQALREQPWGHFRHNRADIHRKPRRVRFVPVRRTAEPGHGPQGWSRSKSLIL